MFEKPTLRSLAQYGPDAAYGFYFHHLAERNRGNLYQAAIGAGHSQVTLSYVSAPVTARSPVEPLSSAASHQPETEEGRTEKSKTGRLRYRGG